MRLMIVLAREDMVKYNLSFSELDWCDHHSRDAIKKLLTLAQEQTGFCTKGRRMLIEAAPGGEGCLILVTLLRAGDKRKVYRVKQPCGIFVFEFEEAEALLCALERLFASGRYPERAQLVLFQDRYRLVLHALGGLSSPAQALLSEYGKPVGKGKPAQAAAIEHGQLLAEGNVIRQIGSRLHFGI